MFSEAMDSFLVDKLEQHNPILQVTQECIPVGCVPPTAVAVGGGGSASVHTGIPLPRVRVWRQPPPGCGSGDKPPRVWACRQPPSRVWACRQPPPGVGLEQSGKCFVYYENSSKMSELSKLPTQYSQRSLKTFNK